MKGAVCSRTQIHLPARMLKNNEKEVTTGIEGSMKQIARSSFFSPFYLRVHLLIYVMLAIISTSSLAEMNRQDWSKTVYMKERPDSVRNSEKSAISPHQHKNNKVDGRRNYPANESVITSNQKNSAALNRFLDDVLNAQNDLKWIDHVTHHINHRIHPNNPLAHTNQYSTVSNMGDVLERADIGYGSRLRGKRGFDRNYETMWMLQKKKYGRKGIRDIPQRVYLDNDMTFKRDADNDDYDALYQFRGTLDRAVYEGGMIADQPLKDWTGKKNLHSSDDWSNSNENPKVTNGRSTWLRNYKPVRGGLVNSGDSNWNEPRSTVEIYDLGGDLDGPLDKETMRRLKRAKNVHNEDESDSRIFQGSYFGEQNSKVSHDRSKRSRRSFVAVSNYTKDQIHFPENNYLKAQVIKDVLENVRNTEEAFTKLHSSYLSHDGNNSVNASNKMNITNSQYFLDKQLFLNNYFNNLTITPSTANQTNIFGLKYSSNTEPYSNDYFINNKSLFVIKTGLQTYNTPERDYQTKVSKDSEEINHSTIEMILKSIDHVEREENRINLPNFGKNTDSIRLSIYINDDDSGKSLKNRNNEEKLGIAAQKISRFSMDDGQSKGAEKEFPRGNMSRGFGMATNESCSYVVETTVAAGGREIEVDGMRKQNREPIPSVIKVFEPRGHPYQKQEAETTTRLSRRMGKDGTSVAKMKMNKDDADESRSTNAREDYSTSPIESAADATKKPKISYINTSEIGELVIPRDLTSVTVNDLQKQQQMVSPLSEENRNANKSNGNLDTDRIDIRVLGSNGNETMNVKEDTRAVMEAHEYHKSDNNLQRKLLWISTISVDGETIDSSVESMRSGFNATTESVINENQQQSKINDSANLKKVLTRMKREDKAEESHLLQDTLNSPISEINYDLRYKRSVYPYENFEYNNEAGNIAVEKEAPINYDEKQEDNEEYQNQNVEDLKGIYNDREEDVFKDNDKAMESRRQGQSYLRQQIDPVRAKVDMLIKQKIDKKHKNSNIYRGKRHSMLDMVQYYDYDDDEEQERDAPISEQEPQNNDNKLLINAKIKRDDKPSNKSGLGKKKNENAEAMMKERFRKTQAKNKEPKEEIIVDLGKRKNKTSDRNDKKPSSLGSSFENIFNEERQVSSKENSEEIDQNKDFENVHHEELAAIKSKRLNQPFEDRTASSKNSEDSYKRKTISNEPLEYMSNIEYPDAIKNILLNIQPVEIMEQSRPLGSKDFHEDFGDDQLEDYYYYQENDSNNIKPLYEELKNVYDWPDGELKSRPRFRGDQRLRYESDDTLDTNPSQLQPLNDRFLGSGQNDNAQRRFQSIDGSWRNADSNRTLASNYFALKVMDDMFKGSFDQSLTEKNSPNIFSAGTTTESKLSTISGDKNIRFAEEQSIIDIDSGSPYENSKYIESKAHEVLKRNLNLEKQAVISSQDLQDESFVESPEWHDDFDDNEKIRLGRGLKAINDKVIFGLNKTYDQDNKLDVESAANTSFKSRVSSQTFHDNSSNSQNWYNNTIGELNPIFNNHHGVSDRKAKNVQESILMNTVNINGDLEAAEQKYVHNQTPRIRRAAISFYDDMSQRDSDEIDRSLDNQFHSSNILEDRSNEVHHRYETGNWDSDIPNVDRYSKIPPTNKRKKTKSGKGSKKNKHTSKKPAKKSKSDSSSSRNRRHHAHRSDMSKNVNRDLNPKQKNKASPLIGRTRIQKSKTAVQGLLRAGMDEAPGEKVLYVENVEDQSTVKPEEDDARRKEITLLLAADNVDDESQMDVALHGELAGKIVEQIFEQIQKNDRLKSVFGPGLHRDHKTEDVITGNIYRQGLDEDGTNHTEAMIKKIMGLLDTLILNEVQRKTCVSLSPDMREFLGWMLEVDQEVESFEETPPLPLVREKIITPEQYSGGKFLFNSISEQEERENIRDVQKKVRILETLVKEYNALTAKEKTRVQTVHDYLIRQLNLLLQYIEARETAETQRKPTSMFGATRARTGNILQYQSAVPNVTNASYSMTKEAYSLPINTYNLYRFNNVSFETADKQLHNSHAAFGHRKPRSLDKIPSKRRRKTKRRKFHNQKNENHRKTKRRQNKHHGQDYSHRTRLSPKYRKSRQKRANSEESDQSSLYYLGFEKPRIYDSLDILDAKLSGKRKRELIDKKNAITENDRLLDLLPIKGKNRVEDEVILLNKREAWKRENEEQLEEVAFGKDMRNSTKREKERFEKLTKGDKRKPISETSSRMKRENIIRETSIGKSTNYSNKSQAALEIRRDESLNNSKISDGVKSENKLELAERRINVFADNKPGAAIDSAAAEVSTEEKLATNAGANNQVKEKLRTINRETKIDTADGSMSFVNLTSDAKPQVSEERQKVSVTEKETDGNTVKLNRVTNYRREKIDPEIELKNLRQGREKSQIYGVANWKMTDYLYDNDNLSRNTLKEKYVAKLDELGDLDTDPENNFVLLRLRNNKWSNDVVEWKLLPIIKRSPYYDDLALSRIHLIEKETPILSNIKYMEPQSDAYLSNPKFWRLKHRRRSNVFNISPVRIANNDNFPHRIHRKAKRASETFKG
ncbi:uncharacterized protein LOC105202175 [Solenopsis invicta]|uniref:uncharacterized protein LOC105202175 n=1 Tax=Solenopsis invicta TaxID=13686 RepID=UPI00193E5B72|nr:uncharacterized protein LOC105202175 [Solenopsis invicta]